MNIRSISTTADTLTTTAENLRVTIPKTAREELAANMRLVTQAETYSPPVLSVAEAVLDAFRNGEEPHTSPNVLAAVSAETIRQTHTITDAARLALMGTIRDHIETITDAFKPTYDKAGAALKEAHAELTSQGIHEIGQLDLNSISVPAATLAIQAREALNTLRDIRTALSSARIATGATNSAQHYITYTGSWNDNGGVRPIQDYWEALDAGHTITLSNTDDATEHKRALMTLDQQREAAIESNYRKSQRTSPATATI